MNDLLRQLGPQQVAGFFLVLGRVSPLFLVGPFFATRLLPRRARGIAAVAIAFGMTPIVTRGQQIPLDVLSLVGLIGKEILIGLAFAYAVGAVLAAASVAGSFLDTLIGFSYGSLVDPITGVQSPVLSQFYGLIATMVFLGIGGDALMVQGLGRSYDLVSLVRYPEVESLAIGAQQAFAVIFTSALELAAPVVLALVITDSALGVLAKVVPQMNVFAVSFAAKIPIGLLIIVVSLPFAAPWLGDRVEQAVSDALRSIEVNRP